MTTTTTTTRELNDVVTACCKVEGIDPGTASAIAANVVAAEVATGDGLEPFLLALSADQALAESPFDWAPNRVIEAELEARKRPAKEADLEFAESVPVAAILATVRAANKRGIEFPNLELPAEPTTPTTPTEPNAASVNGLPVDLDLFRQLRTFARQILVAEAEADAV